MYCKNCGAELGPAVFCQNCEQFNPGPRGVKMATIPQRLGAAILDFLLFILTLVIGYIIWWLITLQWGQTPGKQLLGIRAVTRDGASLGWGMTFIREFVVKNVLFWWLAGGVTGGIAPLVDYLWPLWDKDRQTLHDKMVNSVVVDDRDWRQERPVAA